VTTEAAPRAPAAHEKDPRQLAGDHELPRRGAAAEAARVDDVHPGGPSRPARSTLGAACQIFGVIALGFLLSLSAIGSLQYQRSQGNAYAEFRAQLANGVAPVGPVDTFGHTVALGKPVAIISIPTLHRRDVVLQGSTSGVLMAGPGHLRSSVLPGQAGDSVVLGRRATFGAPFADLAKLSSGDTITVTTGQGTSRFRVVGRRRAGDLVPALRPGAGRLTLATADGSPFAPRGVLWVDAELTSPVLPAPAQLPVASLAQAELPLQGDASGGLRLVLEGQALLGMALVAVVVRRRWGRRQAWLVLLLPLLALSIAVCSQVARLLPNLQ
jgi:sortase (surface protein transpeptidase)